jgi:hypothetical protein
MPAGADDTGQRERVPSRYVQVGGHQEVGPALEYDLLNPIRIPLDGSGHSRPQGRLCRQRTETTRDLVPYGCHIRLRIRSRFERSLGRDDALLSATHLRDKVLLHHAREPVQGHSRRRRRRTAFLSGPRQPAVHACHARGCGSRPQKIPAGYAIRHFVPHALSYWADHIQIWPTITETGMRIPRMQGRPEYRDRTLRYRL